MYIEIRTEFALSFDESKLELAFRSNFVNRHFWFVFGGKSLFVDIDLKKVQILNYSMNSTKKNEQKKASKNQ